MKNIKPFIIFTVIALMLSSCIVKSLYPFYTKDTISFEKKFLGIWKDKDPDNQWIIASIKDYWQEERKHNNLSEGVDFNKI